MIKVEVTHLKAPWPASTSVGAVVALAVAILPGWAAGKCVVLSATDEREPVAVWEPPAAPAEPEFVVNPAAEADRKAAELGALLTEQAQQLQDAEQALDIARDEISSLRADLAGVAAERDAARAERQDAEQALSTARAEIASLMAERDKAVANLAAALATAPKAGKAPKA